MRGSAFLLLKNNTHSELSILCIKGIHSVVAGCDAAYALYSEPVERPVRYRQTVFYFNLACV